MARMTDKIVLVVGGASGIGKAVAVLLAAEGAPVYVTGRREIDVTASTAKIGHGARGIMAAAGTPTDISRAVATLVEDHGRIDALVFNAVMSEPADLMSTIPELVDRHFALNVRGPLLAMQAAIHTCHPIARRS